MGVVTAGGCYRDVNNGTRAHYTVCMDATSHARYSDADVYLGDALLEWQAAGLGGLVHVPPGRCDLPIQVADLENGTHGMTISANWADGNQPLHLTLDEFYWRSACPEQKRGLMLHELGHALGVGHPVSHALDDVMQPNTQTSCMEHREIYR